MKDCDPAAHRYNQKVDLRRDICKVHEVHQICNNHSSSMYLWQIHGEIYDMTCREGVLENQFYTELLKQYMRQVKHIHAGYVETDALKKKC